MRKYLSAVVAFFVAGMLGLVISAQQPVKVVDSTGTDVPVATTTEAAHDGALGTLTAVKALLDMCRAKAAEPSAVSTDDDAVLGWCNLIGARAIFPTANASGGDTACYQSSTASTNAISCKQSPGTVYEISSINITSTIYYLRMYNSATNPPTCSSSSGWVESIPIPQASGAGAGVVRTYPVGRNFSAGIGWCLTSGATGTDTGNAATGVHTTIGYR